MTPPREITPETTFEVTQRTLRRTYRFLPEPRVRQLFLYVLGVAAEKYDIELYGCVLMVTHYHIAGRDVSGQLPDFMQYLNSLLARALNCLQALDDKVWSGDGYTIVRPQASADLASKIAYGMANPADADLVHRIEDYPGVVVSPDDIGRQMVIERPPFFFRETGSMPETVTVRFAKPEEFGHMTLADYRSMLWRELRDRERACRQRRRAEGRSVVGTDRLRKVTLGARATSYEKWFRLRPTIAAKMKSDRIAAIRALQRFRDAYRCALEDWCDGDHDAVFPPGTWWMVKFAGAATG